MNCPHCNKHIDEHEASRCFDAWVAAAVMDEIPFQPGKYQSHDCGDTWFLEAHYPNYPGKLMPCYSNGIVSMWEVIEWLAKTHYVDIGVDKHGAQVQINILQGRRWEMIVESTRAETAPLAVCRAAIKASEETR